MRFARPLSTWLAVASLLTLLATTASTLMAQSAGTSGLSGTVSDQSGAAVPNASVTGSAPLNQTTDTARKSFIYNAPVTFRMHSEGYRAPGSNRAQ